MKRYLRRRWPLFVLAIGCAALFVISIFQDSYGHGHIPIVVQCLYWSFGLRDSRLFSDVSDGEGGIFGDLEQLVLGNHGPTLGGFPRLSWNPYRFEMSG